MFKKVQYLHPQDQAKLDKPTAIQAPTRTMYLRAESILFINEEAIQAQRMNRFTQQPELIDILPPINHFTVFLNCPALPVIFLHKDYFINKSNDPDIGTELMLWPGARIWDPYKNPTFPGEEVWSLSDDQIKE
jgi:hypothetical protein